MSNLCQKLLNKVLLDILFGQNLINLMNNFKKLITLTHSHYSCWCLLVLNRHEFALYVLCTYLICLRRTNHKRECTFLVAINFEKQI